MENNRVENKEDTKQYEMSEDQQKALAAAISNVALNTQIWIETSMMLLIAHLNTMGMQFDPKKCEWGHEPTFVRYDGKTFAKIKLLLPHEEKKLVV